MLTYAAAHGAFGAFFVQLWELQCWAGSAGMVDGAQIGQPASFVCTVKPLYLLMVRRPQSHPLVEVSTYQTTSD